MSDGTVTLRIEKSDNAPSAQVIFDEYDKGTLMNVQIEDVSSDENKSFSKTFEYSGEDYKAFIWDAAGTMITLSLAAGVISSLFTQNQRCTPDIIHKTRLERF